MQRVVLFRSGSDEAFKPRSRAGEKMRPAVLRIGHGWCRGRFLAEYGKEDAARRAVSLRENANDFFPEPATDEMPDETKLDEAES